MSIKSSRNTVKKMNDVVYPQLSADERFKEVMRTFVNEDEVQREKLIKSCPMVSYRESDHAYTERVEASRDIVTTFVIQLLEYDKKISIIKILSETNSQYKSLITEVNFFIEVKSFLLAFDTFCLEYLSIDPNDIIQAWFGYDERYVNIIKTVKEFLNLYQINSDMELVNIWLEKVFIYGWECRIKN